MTNFDQEKFKKNLKKSIKKSLGKKGKKVAALVSTSTTTAAHFISWDSSVQQPITYRPPQIFGQAF